MLHDESVSKLRETLRRCGNGQSKLNPKGLQARLISKTGFDSLCLKDCMTSLRQSGEVVAEAWDEYHGMPLAQMHLNLMPEKFPEHVEQWFKIVLDSDFDDDAKAALQKPSVAEKFKDMPLEAQKRLLRDLFHFRDIHGQLPGRKTVFEAGAEHVLGSSKIFGYIGETLLKSIGITLDALSKGPRYLAVAGPAEPKAVILVENPHSFEAAVESGTDCAWACTYGFGLTLGKGERLGQMLVDNLTTYCSSLKKVTRVGSPPEIQDLLSHPKLFFWGDLDIAGLNIFTQLKSSFPHIRLSALYEPMLSRLAASGGHPYTKCVGKEGQKSFRSNDPLVQHLLEACLEQGLDQESLSMEDIRIFADREFSF